jgi:hypothetical protein
MAARCRPFSRSLSIFRPRPPQRPATPRLAWLTELVAGHWESPRRLVHRPSRHSPPHLVAGLDPSSVSGWLVARESMPRRTTRALGHAIHRRGPRSLQGEPTNACFCAFSATECTLSMKFPSEKLCVCGNRRAASEAASNSLFRAVLGFGHPTACRCSARLDFHSDQPRCLSIAP